MRYESFKNHTMERLLHYVWKYRLYTAADLKTPDGLRITVIDPGIQNTHAGADFFNAKVKIADTVWVGNVEIHQKASDWKRHLHHRDAAYDSVILHVVADSDARVCRSNGEVIPQAVMHIPPRIKNSLEWLLSREQSLPCSSRLGELDPLYLASWNSALLTERLERKTEDVFARLKRNQNDWNEVFYITLTRNFGFGTNSDAFEWLAQSLPFQYIRKQRNNSQHIEALLFGQAGLLEGDQNDPYYLQLQQMYAFFRQRYNLQPLDPLVLKKMRLRPTNFPHLRLAQLAAVWTHHDTLFSQILEDKPFDTLKGCFDVSLPAFWDTHYHFDYPSAARKKTIGLNATHIVLINTVVPILFAYGKQKNEPDYCVRALQMLEQIPAERNSLVSCFTQAGLGVKNAYDTQALIQLRQAYCDKKKCLYCRIGFQLIKAGQNS